MTPLDWTIILVILAALALLAQLTGGNRPGQGKPPEGPAKWAP